MIFKNKLFLFIMGFVFMPIVGIRSASSNADLDTTRVHLANCFIEPDKCVLQSETHPYTPIFPYTKNIIFKAEDTIKKIRSWKYYKYVGKVFCRSVKV
jgi:hypothetical protein